MLAWLSLNMGLRHELIQNERGCLIYEASPRFVFGRLYGVESSSERVFCRCGTIIREGIFEYSCGAFRLFARAFSNIRVEHFEYSLGRFRMEAMAPRHSMSSMIK